MARLIGSLADLFVDGWISTCYFCCLDSIVSFWFWSGLVWSTLDLGYSVCIHYSRDDMILCIGNHKPILAGQAKLCRREFFKKASICLIGSS